MVLKVDVGEEIEQLFREAAMRTYGYQRGAIQKATKEALRQWTMQRSQKLPKVEDPFPLVEGILGKLSGKKTSVDLQHEAMDLWAKKYL